MTNPEYLPPQPDGLFDRELWNKQILAVETYRMRWGHDDPEDGLGPRPKDRMRLKEWDQAHLILDPEHEVDIDSVMINIEIS